MVASEQLIDITDLAENYASETIDFLNNINPGWIDATKINGKLYAITGVYSKAASVYFIIKNEYLEQTGLDLSAVKNGDDLEEIVAAVDAISDTTVICAQGETGAVLLQSQQPVDYNDFSNTIIVENFGNLSYLFGVIMGDDNTDVVNYYETEYMAETLALTYDWFNKGYIQKDAATQTESAVELIKAGGSLSSLSLAEENILDSDITYGFDMEYVKLAQAIINTGTLQKFCWAMPVTCDEPEAAMKFLNLTNTNEEVTNLLNYGIEGTHYIKNENGTISYPEGIDTTNSPYSPSSSFIFANQFLAYVWDDKDPDLRSIALENNKAAPVSAMMGFTVDQTGLEDYIAELTNVYQQYAPGLQSGSADPSTELPKFNAALKAAGLDDVMAAVQTQVDAFYAEQ